MSLYLYVFRLFEDFMIVVFPVFFQLPPPREELIPLFVSQITFKTLNGFL